MYHRPMQRRIIDLSVKVGLPVLTGQFVFDWLSSDLRSAITHLPTRAILIFAVLLLWAAFREHRERKKRTCR
jgi:hypothetical protein